MERITDLVTEVETALDDDDYIEVSDLICEAFTHMSDFNRGECEVWDWSDIKEALHEVGELIYEKDGFDAMQGVHNDVYMGMGPLAARYLEKAWNGCGDGAWRS